MVLGSKLAKGMVSQENLSNETTQKDCIFVKIQLSICHGVLKYYIDLLTVSVTFSSAMYR